MRIAQSIRNSTLPLATVLMISTALSGQVYAQLASPITTEEDVYTTDDLVGTVTLNNGGLNMQDSLNFSNDFIIQGTDGYINSNGYSTYFSGVISGSGDLTFVGDEIYLNNSNTNTGTITLNSAKLYLNTANALNSSNSLVLNSNSTLYFQDFDTTVTSLTSGDSSSTIVLGGANLTINNATDETYNGHFGEIGREIEVPALVAFAVDVPSVNNYVIKTGAGNLTLTGNNSGRDSYTLDVKAGTVTQGTNSNSYWNGDVIVESGATFSNYRGTVSGTTTINGGTVYNYDELTSLVVNDGGSLIMITNPNLVEGGNSYTITNDITVNNGGSVEVFGNNNSSVGNFNPSNGTFNSGSKIKYHITNSGNSDTYNLGNVTVNSGTILQPVVLGDRIASNQSYIVYQAGGMSSSYSSFFNILDNYSYLSFALRDEDRGEMGYRLWLDVTVGAASFADIVPTGGRGHSVAQVLDGINEAGDVDSNMQNLMNQMMTMTDDEIVQSVNKLMPDASGAAPRVTMDVVGQVQNLVGNRIAPAITGVSSGDVFTDNAFWTQGFYNKSNQNADSGIEGYNADTKGAAWGVDGEIAKNSRLGLAYGYSKTGSDNTTNKLNMNSNTFMLYGSYDTPHWVYDAMASYSMNNYDSKRITGFGTAVASFNGNQYALRVDAMPSLICTPATNVTIMPIFSGRYSHIDLDGYSETGAPGANLTLDKQKYDTLTAGVGGKLTTTRKQGNEWSLQPSMSAMYTYDVLQDNVASTAQFVSGGSAFTTNGITPSRNALELSGEVVLSNTSGMDLTANYTGQFRSGYDSHTGLIMLRHSF